MDTTLEVLFILCVCISFYYVTQMFKEPTVESFSQNQPFETKQNQDIYDSFYVSMYDRIHKTKSRSHYDLIKIIEITQPPDNSIFLDIGSGTGHMVHCLEMHGYRAFGIDSSKSMIEHSTKQYPTCEYKCGNAQKPMEFESNTFTYILCTHFTLYEFPDKSLFFQNCRRWLRVGGIIVVHLVDKSNFDTVVPIGKIADGIENTQEHTSERILTTSVTLSNATYINKYEFSHPIISSTPEHVVKRVETFTNHKTKHTRHHEVDLYMEPIEDIIQIAKRHGFFVKGIVDYFNFNRDKHQFLYFFEKMDV